MTAPAARSRASWLVCPSCSAELDELSAAVRCPRCGGLLEVRHSPPLLEAAALRELFDSRMRPSVESGVPSSEPPSRRAAEPSRSSGVWRFQELILPDATEILSYPEGDTPLVFREAVARWAGVADLTLKHEGMNPTGSFKDRGMTVGLTQALRVRTRAVACASTGNTAASLAAYAAHAGLPAYVLIPAGGIASGKLAQAVGFGARVVAVRGDFDACLRLAEEASTELGLYLLNSVNPFRLEGQKTIVFELLQQRGWVPPDWIVLPGGNLGNTAAFGSALVAARAVGLIDQLPRLAVVQAEGAAPFARSFAGGFREPVTVRAETVASAIRIGNPASWDRAARAIRETNGVVLAVPDEEILAAQAVINRAGVGCEPASAASVAGVRRLVGQGTIAHTASVVAILTGHMLKDPEILLGDHRVREIEPALEALRAGLRP